MFKHVYQACFDPQNGGQEMCANKCAAGYAIGLAYLKVFMETVNDVIIFSEASLFPSYWCCVFLCFKKKRLNRWQIYARYL